ncbi:hypothetical protein TNCV_3670091 [Trichonephila clavipes]|nr:hypothetical protein TNCV_3670091 [Trichonephila clavipes]
MIGVVFDVMMFGVVINPMEHKQDIFGCSVSARTTHPTAIEELKMPLVQEWVWSPQGSIRTLAPKPLDSRAMQLKQSFCYESSLLHATPGGIDRIFHQFLILMQVHQCNGA